MTSPVVAKKPNAPSEGILKLLSPDGYYTYLGIEKPKPTESDPNPGVVDEEQIKKNYRKLSLLHHPDRKNGDSDTFRVLNRAQTVLTNPKLRQQYDLLGLDLDDDEEDHAHGDDGDDGEEGTSSSSTADSVMSQIASLTLATIFQAIVRTVMMGLVSVILVRFRLTLFPALAFMVYVAYRVHTVAKATKGTREDMLSPLLIGVGLIFMYRGRTVENPWSWGFWAGECLVVCMFTYNSVPQKSRYIALGVAVVALFLTLWLRGNAWKYATLVGLELFVAVVAALAFPIMEMILEQILNEKMRKVGEKVRAHSERLESYYGKVHVNGNDVD